MKTEKTKSTEAPQKSEGKSGQNEGVISNQNWTRWILQTARKWEDIDEIIKITGIDTIDNDHRKMAEYALEINNLIDLFEKEGLFFGDAPASFLLPKA